MRINTFLIFCFMVLVVIGCGNAEQKAKRQQQKEAAAKLSAAAADFAKLPEKTQLTSAPYITGKMVIVRQDNEGGFYMYYPDLLSYGEAYAQTPEEVQTVVLRVCKRTQKGVYRTKENPPRELPAFGTDCIVTIVDRTIPAVIYKKRFEAVLRDEAVATEKNQNVEAHAGYEIDEFLKSLPRR